MGSGCVIKSGGWVGCVIKSGGWVGSGCVFILIGFLSENFDKLLEDTSFREELVNFR